MLMYFFFLLSLFLYLCCSNLVGVWLSLVFSLFSTMYMFKGVESDSSLKYIFIQEFSTWAFLLGLILKNSVFFSFGLMLKMGYPPFHAWFLEVFRKNLKISNWLLGPSKVTPGFFLICFFNSSILILLFSSLILSSIMLLGGSSLSTTLVFSSNTNGFFFMLLCLSSLHSAFFYFCMYSFFLFFLLDMNPNSANSSWESLTSLSGLPPGHIFFLKMISLFSSGEWLLLLLFLLFVSTFPIFFSYIQLFEKKKVFSQLFFFSQNKNLGGWHMIMFLVLFFFIFSS